MFFNDARDLPDIVSIIESLSAISIDYLGLSKRRKIDCKGRIKYEKVPK